jgi:RNA polymerase sigma-70 factor (ECF subfamily)
MQTLNDEKLVSQYLKGDDKSLEILVKRYLKPIYSFTYRYVGNLSDAQDITQEIFLKAWRNLKKPALRLLALNFAEGSKGLALSSPNGFDSQKGSFKTWIFSIAKNASIDFLRKSRSASGLQKTVSFSDFENERGENPVIGTLADASPLQLELVEQADTAKLLTAALDKLSSKYRMILFLRYNDHFTFREIAESLGESLNTIKSRHRRALIQLRELFAQEGLLHQN